MRSDFGREGGMWNAGCEPLCDTPPCVSMDMDWCNKITGFDGNSNSSVPVFIQSVLRRYCRCTHESDPSIVQSDPYVVQSDPFLTKLAAFLPQVRTCHRHIWMFVLISNVYIIDLVIT